MLDHVKDTFLTRLQNDIVTDPNMQSIPLAYIMQLDIPDSIKHFFDQEVEIWLREEEEKFTSTERFDYDMPQVRMLIDQIFDLLKQNATFHITKFNHLLERAVKLQMNYMLEPHRTLTQFLFKDSPRISTMEVYDTLKYFFRFDYYKTAISEYFNLKYMREISQDQFVSLIEEIDRKTFEELRADTALKTVKTIMEFLSEAQNESVTSLPTDVLAAIFRDRKIDDFYQLIKSVENTGNKSQLTFDELETLLRDGSLPGFTTEEVAEKTEILGFDHMESIETAAPEISLSEFDVPETTIQLEEEEAEDELELEEEEEIEQEDEEEVAQPEPEPTMEEEAEPEVSEKVANDLADFVAKQISSDSPLEDLHEMIKGRIRKKIIKKLFKKKENEFVDFVDHLNALATWKDASRVIDDEFYERGINPYSKEAIAFSDIIYMRFFPKDKYVGGEDSLSRF